MAGKGKGTARTTTEVRLRLDPDTAKKLQIVATLRDMTPSELVEWALLPHLSFKLPELPGEVTPRPILRRPAG